MSENLIYGADIQSYGAVCDGKTDCSDAFIKAIENGESLICVPYGTYILTKPVELSSNVKLHLHPSACLKFAPSSKDIKKMFYAKNGGGIEICGGILDIGEKAILDSVLSFDGCESVRISNCTINAPHVKASVLFKNTSSCCISNVTFNGMSDCVKLLGECENITFKNSTVRASANVLQLGEAKVKTDVKGLYVRNIDVSFCDSFFEFLNGSANLVSAENIKARISFSFAKLFDIFDLEDSEFENIKAYLIDRGLNADKTKCYFSFASCPDGLEIRTFERVSDVESIPFAPTFIMKNTNADTGKLLIDGMALDNVIAARGKSKTVAMTTAKLANPCNKFIYTLEVGVSKDDSFTMPLGSFDYMSINRR